MTTDEKMDEWSCLHCSRAFDSFTDLVSHEKYCISSGANRIDTTSKNVGGLPFDETLQSSSCSASLVDRAKERREPIMYDSTRPTQVPALELPAVDEKGHKFLCPHCSTRFRLRRYYCIIIILS